MKVSKRSLFVLILVAVLVTSCAPTVAETPDINASLTAGVSTFAAYFFQTQTAMVTPATVTPTPSPSPTMTPVTPTSLTASPTALAFFPVLATSTFAPVVTITGTNYTRTAAPVAYGCNNLQILVDEPLTYQTTTLSYTKSWKVKNAGTCNWTAGYRFVRVSGSLGPATFSVRNYPVEPEKWQTYEVSFDVLPRSGTYSASWQLADASGHKFGSILAFTLSYP